MAHSTVLWPIRSPAMPITGANKVPIYWTEANAVSSTTEPVSTSTYQPRITFSISKPQEVSRSAGYWKRKLRTWNGASSETEATALIPFRIRDVSCRPRRAGRKDHTRDGDTSHRYGDTSPIANNVPPLPGRPADCREGYADIGAPPNLAARQAALRRTAWTRRVACRFIPVADAAREDMAPPS